MRLITLDSHRPGLLTITMNSDNSSATMERLLSEACFLRHSIRKQQRNRYNVTNLRFRFYRQASAQSGVGYYTLTIYQADNFTFQDFNGPIANSSGVMYNHLVMNDELHDFNISMYITKPYIAVKYGMINYTDGFSMLCGSGIGVGCGAGRNNTVIFGTLTVSNYTPYFPPANYTYLVEAYNYSLEGENFTYRYSFYGFYPATCNNIFDHVSLFNDTVTNNSYIYHTVENVGDGSHNLTISCLDFTNTTVVTEKMFFINNCNAYNAYEGTDKELAGGMAALLCNITDPSAKILMGVGLAVVVLSVVFLIAAHLKSG